jgi:hypothetical protein
VVSRVNFLETMPERINDVARVVREVVHPGISGEPGYVGCIVLGDRDNGNAIGVTLWETDEARKSSDAKLERSGRGWNRAPAARCGKSGSTTFSSSTFERDRRGDSPRPGAQSRIPSAPAADRAARGLESGAPARPQQEARDDALQVPTL